MNVIDRFLVDDWWVGHTKAWIIPGTEDLRPYITSEDKRKKMDCRNCWNGSDLSGAGSDWCVSNVVKIGR